MCAAHRFVDDLVHQTQRLEPVRGDAQRLGCLLRLVRGLPQNRCAALRTDDRIDRILQHQHLIRDRNRQRTAGAALADDGGDDRHLQLRHLEDVAPDRLRLPALFGVNAGVGARRVHEGEHREPELFGRLHEAQGLSITLGFAHAEVAQAPLACIATFLLPHHHAGGAIEAREPADDAQVVGKVAVSVQFDEVSEDVADVVQRVRALGMPRNLGDLPRREVRIDVFGELQALLAELVDFFRNVDGGLGLHIAQLFDLAFEIGNRLLEIEKCSFGQRLFSWFAAMGGCPVRASLIGHGFGVEGAPNIPSRHAAVGCPGGSHLAGVAATDRLA